MERYRFMVMVFLLFPVIGLCTGSIFQPLHAYLSSKLHPYVVPQTDPSNPLTVGVQVGLIAIDDVDRRRNELYIRSWLLETWNSSITWNPEDFNGLKTIRLSARRGFVPLTASLSSAGFVEIMSPLETRYVHNGLAVFFVNIRWRLLCDLSEDENNNNNDTCSIKMYSSDYDNSVIQLRHPKNFPVDLDKMTAGLRMKKPMYEIVSESHSLWEETVKGIPGAHDWVEYQFAFKKRRFEYFNGPTAIFKWH